MLAWAQLLLRETKSPLGEKRGGKIYPQIFVSFALFLSAIRESLTGPRL